MSDKPIVISDYDAQRLHALLAAAARAPWALDDAHLRDLRAELQRALVLKPAEIPVNVIRVHSRVRVRDRSSGEREEYVLVFPSDVIPGTNRVSVLAPLGIALLGYREGDDVVWDMPGGLRRLQVERVEQGFSPAAGEKADRHAPGPGPGLQ